MNCHQRWLHSGAARRDASGGPFYFAQNRGHKNSCKIWKAGFIFLTSLLKSSIWALVFPLFLNFGVGTVRMTFRKKKITKYCLIGTLLFTKKQTSEFVAIYYDQQVPLLEMLLFECEKWSVAELVCGSALYQTVLSCEWHCWQVSFWHLTFHVWNRLCVWIIACWIDGRCQKLLSSCRIYSFSCPIGNSLVGKCAGPAYRSARSRLQRAP